MIVGVAGRVAAVWRRVSLALRDGAQQLPERDDTATISTLQHLPTILLLIAWLQPAQSSASEPEGSAFAAPGSAVGFSLRDDTVVLPLTMVREYPFVRGRIDGVDGLLMLDTGGPDALVVNDHRVHLPNTHVVGTSFYASGQQYEEHRAEIVDEVVLSTGITYRRIRNVSSWDGSQLEQHISPEFLGWVGYDFFRESAMVLDYKAQTVTFHKGSNAVERALRGEQVVARLPYETRRRPNDPVVHVRIGSVDFVGAFDTGQYGTLYTSLAVRRTLEREGVIRPAGKTGDTSYDLTGLRVGEAEIGAVAHVDIKTEPAPFAAGTGLTEPNIVTIGYGVLALYKTVWDFPRRTIYLLPR